MYRITKKGVPGHYSVKNVRMFNHVTYHPGDGSYKLLDSVPAGNYGGSGNPGAPDIKPCPNKEAKTRIKNVIDSHARTVSK